jgi:Putative MetA-pathway of phenol degradation
MDFFMNACLEQRARFYRKLLGIAALSVSNALPAHCQEAEKASQGTAVESAAAKELGENTGTDFTSPVNSFEVRFQYRPSSAPGSETEKEYAILRATTRIELEEGWKVSLYAQTEGEAKQTLKSSGSTDDAGLGDSVLQAVLIREFNERWAAGAGARVVAPTASDDLGSGKWQVMPGFGVRYSFLELGDETFVVPQMRYAVSVAGTASSRDISELQIAPLFNLDLPGRWFLTLYPSYDIRINLGPPVPGQTGRLFLPADAEIGYRLGEHIVIALEGSVPIVKDYPVYDFKTQLRFIFKN